MPPFVRAQSFAGPFWLRRFVRIFPAYWIALTAFVYFFGFASIHGVANFLTFFGLLQNYRGGYALFGFGIAWTLVIEVSFYLALPLINQIARVVAGLHTSIERVYRVQIGISRVARRDWVGNTGAQHLGREDRPRGGVVSPARERLFPFRIPRLVRRSGMAFVVLSVWSATGKIGTQGRRGACDACEPCWVVAVGVFALQARLIGPTS